MRSLGGAYSPAGGTVVCLAPADTLCPIKDSNGCPTADPTREIITSQIRVDAAKDLEAIYEYYCEDEGYHIESFPPLVTSIVLSARPCVCVGKEWHDLTMLRGVARMTPIAIAAKYLYLY